MTLFNEQLSAVRKSQWEAQLDALRTLGTRALDNTGQLIALNMKTSRATVEQAAGAFRQILDARDPRDLFAVGTNAQRQWQHLFSYGRELLDIAASARPQAWSAPAAVAAAAAPGAGAPGVDAPGADAPATVPQALEQAAIGAAVATTVTSEIAAAAVDTGHALAQATLHAVAAPDTDAGVETDADTGAETDTGADTGAETGTGAAPQPDAAPAPEPTELDAEKTGAAPSETPRADDAPAAGRAQASLAGTAGTAEEALEQALADEAPTARAKPLAEALGKVGPKPAGVGHPLASTLPLRAGGHVDLPLVTPVENAPPLHAPAREPKGARASRKK